MTNEPVSHRAAIIAADTVMQGLIRELVLCRALPVEAARHIFDGAASRAQTSGEAEVVRAIRASESAFDWDKLARFVADRK